MSRTASSTSLRFRNVDHSKVQHLTFCRMIIGPFTLPFGYGISTHCTAVHWKWIYLVEDSTECPIDWSPWCRSLCRSQSNWGYPNRWESFAEKYNVLLRYLNRLYPNLTVLTITVQDFYGLHDAITNGMVHIEEIHRMNIKLPFHNLQRLEVNVMSIDDAIDLFCEMDQLSTIKNVAVLFEVDWSERLKVMDLMEAEFKFIRSHCEMMQMVGVYFEHFGYSVHGVTEQMQMEWHWKVYSRYLSLITEMVESGVIIDGHLRFEMNIMRSSIYRNNTVNVECGRTLWNKDNVEQSLLIDQRICRIQSAVQQYNDKLSVTEWN